MNCPVCKTSALSTYDLEADLFSLECSTCGGQWIQSFRYWKWREVHRDDLPELPPTYGVSLPTMDSEKAKLCPECGYILLPYRVGYGIEFALDHCGHCGGTWLDRDEWEALRSRNLHDDLHLIFSTVWQRRFAHAEHERKREERLRATIGKKDLEEIRKIKAWLDSHPHRNELIALLLTRPE